MNSEIVDSFASMVREKGIDKDMLAGIVEEVFSMLVRKKYGQDVNFSVVVNMDKGDIEIFRIREVVEKVENPVTQIDVETARELSGEDMQVGEEYAEIVDLSAFGRRLIVSAKQTLNQKIKEIERDNIFNEYSNAIGEIVVGEIYQIRRDEILINHNRNELVLPKKEQIFKERYKKGESIRAVIKEVKKNASNPVVIVSRADPQFLIKLFEMEIPEIYDGIIEIKAIAREPGERAKVAVESHDDRIDAVGACVGMKGVRIHTIVRELNNENIDVINYSDQPAVFIQRALAPAKLKAIEVDEQTKTANVIVSQDQVSLAIGRNGQNIRLASKLTGYEINLIKEGGEEEYDIDLVDFKEELGEDLYQKLIEKGMETATDIINAKLDTLLEIEGLTEEKVKELREMIQRGLEEAEVEEEEEEEEEDEEEEEGEESDLQDEDDEEEEDEDEGEESEEEKSGAGDVKAEEVTGVAEESSASENEAPAKQPASEESPESK
jgi:N utilization substance protein A